MNLTIKPIAFLVSVIFVNGLFAQDWETTFESALATAKHQEKPLILVFSGSDWCGPCKRLDREIWQSDEFKSYAKDHYVLYNADFPRKKKNQLPTATLNTNKQLAAKYNTKGYFPLVVVMNADQQVLGTADYQRIKPSKYIKLLNSYLN